MRVFAVSDLHVDYEENAAWVEQLSQFDFRQDVLIVAGDISDGRSRLGWCLRALVRRFSAVLFVPGNHDLWVMRERIDKTSVDKFVEVNATAAACGASVHPFSRDGVTIVPLLTWYDYSFGEPSEELKSVWMDFRACRWPAGFSERDVAAYFSALNAVHVDAGSDTVITYSHFVPRLDLMPDHIPQRQRYLYPVLGASRLDAELRRLRPQMHVYGHSHINRRVVIDGVCYINNAFGYPHEHQTTAKRLLCVHGDATARPTVSRGANEP